MSRRDNRILSKQRLYFVLNNACKCAENFRDFYFDVSENKLAKDVYEEKEKDESGEEKSKDEVVFIQDVGFSVKIVSPGAEPFDIQVKRKETHRTETIQKSNLPPTY